MLMGLDLIVVQVREGQGAAARGMEKGGPDCGEQRGGLQEEVGGAGGFNLEGEREVEGGEVGTEQFGESQVITNALVSLSLYY